MSMDDNDDMMDMYDGSTESDDDRLLTPLGDSYDALRHRLLIKDKTCVLTALRILRKNSSEREGTIFHTQGMQTASRLAPEIINLLRIGDRDIQDNASWVLVNISAGSLEQARTVISADAIPLMANILRARETWEGSQETELNIVWCFMNLATDREEFGKVLIANGVLDILIGMVENVPASHLLLTTIAALAALQAEISWDITCKRLPDVVRYIQWPNDKDELDDACRSLDYMLKRYNRQSLAIPESVMSKVPYLIRYLTHSYRHVQRSSRSVLNTIASGSDEESQALLDANILDVLTKFLHDPIKTAYACTTISKLTAGNESQIARIMECGIMKKLIHILTNRQHDLIMWREAAWAVANALDGRRSPEQFRTLVLEHAIEPLCKVLMLHSTEFATKGDEGQLKSETTFRLLRCLDQASMHLPELKGEGLIIQRDLALIEEVFTTEGYRNYRRDSKNGITSPDPDPDFERNLTLAMKRFSLDDDPEDSLTKKMNTVKIKENENTKDSPRSPFQYRFG